MYLGIYANIEQVLNEISPNHVKVYEELVNSLITTDVSKNTDFQKKYRSFWVMRYVSPSSKFNKKYFDFLELNKNNSNVDFLDTCNSFEKYPSDAAGEKTIFQFSFLTKLIHMIDGVYPVYDSKVSAFYLLPSVSGASFDQKKHNASILVNCLIQEQKDGCNSKEIKSSIIKFRTKFGAEKMSDEKILDSLIWGYVKFREKSISRVFKK